MSIINIIKSIAKGRSKYKYYCSGDYYANHDNLSEYFRLIKRIDVDKPLLTDNEIFLRKDWLFNTTRKSQVLQRYGKPYFKQANKEAESEIELFLYKILIGKHKVRLETHFFNKTLFYYNYYFSHVNDVERNEVIKTLENKYLNGGAIDAKSQYIMDKHQSIVIIDDTVDFKIHYLSSISDAIDLFRISEKNGRYRSAMNIDRKQKELYEKL